MTTNATRPLRVRVRLFAVQRELAGTREVALELPDSATVEDAWSAIVGRVPALAPGRTSVRFAVNGDYADAGHRLVDGDEVAFIPPVSGGDEAAGRNAPDETHRILELREEPFPADILT